MSLNGGASIRLASERGNIEAVKSLKLQGLTLEDIRSYKNYSLRLASKNGHIDIVKYLIDQGLDLNDIRSDNNYAFRRACYNGHIDIVKYLVSKGLSIDDIRSLNNSSIRLAAHYGHAKVVQFLIDQGLSESDIKTNDDYAFRYACDRKYLDIVQILMGQYSISDNIVKNIDYWPLFFIAIKNNQVEFVKFLSKNGLLPKLLKWSDEWILQHACCNGYTDMIDIIISDKTCSDTVFNADKAFEYACYRGHKSIAEYLAKRKIDIEVCPDLRWELEYASRKGIMNVIKIIVAWLTLSIPFVLTTMKYSLICVYVAISVKLRNLLIWE